VCSDTDEHRRRVEARSTDIAGHSLPTWSDIVERDYSAWSGNRIIVDTARLDVEGSVQTILAVVSSLDG
jgi:hypothetical protein